MCESNAFLRRGVDEELLLEEVVVIEPVAEGYLLRNLFGEEITVKGRLAGINLLKHRVIFEPD